MRKIAVLLTLIAFLTTAGVASAKEGRGGDEGNRARIEHKSDLRLRLFAQRHDEDQNEFVLFGKVKSVSGANIVVTAEKASANNTIAAGTDVTVKTDADTKFRLGKDQVALADIKVGYTVHVKGEVNGTEYSADWIHVKMEKRRVMGEVTAKTDTSVTIKNNVTGVTTTVPVNDETKVTINGEVKTLADVHVGDKGVVKAKGTLKPGLQNS